MFGNAAETALNSTPLLFTLEELERCDTRPKPKLNLKFFEEPKNDNEMLFNLQKNYYDAIANKDTKKADYFYWEMWKRAAKVARRIIIKKVRARGLEFAPDEINDKVSDTCLYLLRRFKTKKNYHVTTNWIVAIRDSIFHALDYQNNIDKATSYIGSYNDLGRLVEDKSDYSEGE